MAERYRVNLTLQAADHLAEIFHYIEKDSPEHAARMIERILAATDSMDILPHRYPVIEAARSLGEEIRSMPVPPYLVRYHIDDARRLVTILSVRHGARRPGTWLTG